MPPSIVWFRQDLRLADNPALDASSRAGPVVPVYVWSPGEEGDWPLGAASRWWLHRSLQSLDADLRSRGSRLTIRSAPAAEALTDIARATGADAVHWSRRYEPSAAAQDERVRRRLAELGLRARAYGGSLLTEPGELVSGSGEPYRVFTPFYRAALQTMPPARPLPAPSRLDAPADWPVAEPLASLKLEPARPWDAGMRAAWQPGEAGALAALHAFVAEHLLHYAETRDVPGLGGVSRLSPHLHFGEISPRQVWAAADVMPGAEPFLRQLMWREFSYHLLVRYPRSPIEPLRSEFAEMPWRDDEAGIMAWQRGRTGYPMVDAAMRELWRTGWMHNRARMLAASFLTKHLLLPWQEGARWFWDTLVDADLANNTQGWQWTAGCGADAAPYFRVFSPITQGERYDSGGAYVREWVPELAGLADEWVHRPWEAPADVLHHAGVRLGETYPEPVVDHAVARRRALRAYQSVRIRRAANPSRRDRP